MLQFKDIFRTISANTSINFDNLVKHREAVMRQQGFRTDSINWELYAKILKAKHQELKNS